MPGLISSVVRSYVRHAPIRKGKYHMVLAMARIDAPEKIVSKVNGRFLMELDISEYLQRMLYYFGFIEKDLTDLIEASLGPGSVMVDVGANVGTFSLLAASLGASCHSFEAAPKNCEILRSNIALNHFSEIKVYECALSDHRGEATFFVYEEPGVRNMCGQNALFRRGAGPEIRVPMETLDNVLKDAPRIDFIKCDVEGADYLVMRGAHEILEKHHPIVALEASSELSGKLGGSVEDILETLWGHGYEVSQFGRSGLELVTRATPPIHWATLVARYPSPAE